MVRGAQRLQDPQRVERPANFSCTLRPPSVNKDERVQKAALQAVRESRLADAAAVLAGALPFLPRALAGRSSKGGWHFHKDQKTLLPDLIAFLKSRSAPADGMLNMVLQIIASLPTKPRRMPWSLLAIGPEFSDRVARRRAVGAQSKDLGTLRSVWPAA